MGGLPPDLNPDEYLNADLKAGIKAAAPARNKEQLKKTVLGHMRMLQMSPGRVESYFKHQKLHTQLNSICPPG